jgi:hypothetical protein
MQPHQQRVVDEKAELDEKLEKLEKFIHENDLFQKLPSDEQERMCRQQNAMKQYSEVLGERIAAFPPSSLTIVP